MKRKISRSLRERKWIIKEVLSLSQKSEREILRELGYALKCEYTARGVKFAVKGGYLSGGINFWASIKKKLYRFFCSPVSRRPKAWVTEVVSGDIRNIVLVLVAAVVRKLNVGFLVAIYIVALIVKKGMGDFCRRPPIKKPIKLVPKKLHRKKTEMVRLKKRFRKIREKTRKRRRIRRIR